MARKWSRDEEILAFALYCETPFGKIHSSNPAITKLAGFLKRTPASISMKMCNFARFDSHLQARGVLGLRNGSHLDEEIWTEFSPNMEFLEQERNRIVSELDMRLMDEDYSSKLPAGDSVKSEVNIRRNQAFFRHAVLTAYGNACCVTGLDLPALLTASHIKPWKDSNPLTERTNPQNGLCMNALHDRAFDRGLITISTDYRIVVSKTIKELYSKEAVQNFFTRYDGQKIRLPEKFLPERQFIEFHNEMIFEKSEMDEIAN